MSDTFKAVLASIKTLESTLKKCVAEFSFHDLAQSVVDVDSKT